MSNQLYEKVFNDEIAPIVTPVAPVSGAKHRLIADFSASDTLEGELYTGRETLTVLLFFCAGGAYAGGETLAIKLTKNINESSYDLESTSIETPALTDGGFAAVPVTLANTQYADFTDISGDITLSSGVSLAIIGIFETADSKALKTVAQGATVTTEMVSSDEPEITPVNNKIFNCGALTSIEITAPASFPADFACQLNFTSGETPTSFASTDVTYTGDNTSDGIFTPIASRRYSIMFYSNGTDMIGAVKGV